MHRSSQLPSAGSSAAEPRLFGACPAFLDALADAKRVAQRDDFHVLILGENGTGKEEVARYIHSRSSRAAKPLVVVNCGAIASDLFESEMFGHERGAFTGAVGAKKGLFEQADGGILFLDEIGELPLEHQPKLLRAIQNGEIRRVGGETVRRMNVRIIAATNRDLWSMVKDGRFREDLYFRIAEWPLKLPPLRQRGGDILGLARRALDAADFGDKTLSADAERLLSSYRWPGNIRELANVVKRAALRSSADQITAGDIAPALVDLFPNAAIDDTGAAAANDLFVPDAADGLDLERAVCVARELLATKPRFKRAEFSSAMKLDKSQSNKRLKQLVEHGIIRACGRGPTTFYVALAWRR